MEHPIMTRQPEAFHQGDYDHNLPSLSNTNDHSFLDLGKGYGQISDNLDHHHNQHMNEYESHQNIRVPRDDHASYQDARMNSSYSPMGLSHHNNNHFTQGMNTTFHFNNVKQQPYQQERFGYGNYHPQQQYSYQNHYDTQMMHPAHDNRVDYYHQHPQEIIDTHQDDVGLMWSEDPASKAMKMRNVQMNGSYNDPALKPKLNINPGYGHYEQENDDDMYAYKRSQMMSIPHDLSRAPVRRALEPQLSGISVNGMELKDLANGRIMQTPRPGQKPATKVEAYNDDDEDDDSLGEGKGRSTRGLRVLSLKVKEIVNQKKRTTYKEVAETLTHELRQKSAAKSVKEETKDEQNVKRRVYDALNVLIAAGVLRKEGKIVYCEESSMMLGYNNKRNSKESREKYLLDIQEARKRNKAKVEALHELIFKCLAIKNLIKSNKEKAENGGDKKPKARPSAVNATRIEVVQENPALKPKNEDVIKFPFIVLLSSSPDNSMNLNMDTSQRQLAIESKKPFNIFGDIDVLLKMGLHYVSRQMFDEIIPFELQKFVPKYFLAALK